MTNFFRVISPALALALMVSLASMGSADENPKPEGKSDEPKQEEKAEDTSKEEEKVSAAAEATKAAAAKKTAEKPKPKYPPFDKLLDPKERKTIEGLIKLHLVGTKLYAELGSGQLNKDYIVLISIAKGMGQQPLLGGMSWGFGDDWVWQFRKVGDRIHLVRRNVRFTATKGSPEANAVKLAYTDSVLFSLPIATRSPSGVDVVDLSPVFMSDLPQISHVLKGFSFSRTKSTWASVKGYPKNIELQVAATYASGGTRSIESVADTRGVTIHVHYSISALPKTGYKPRMADDRIGYFLTVVKDYSKQGPYDRFVRYVNRWDLQKADPKADISPPKKPIIFYLEKTIPFKYRKPIRDGVLEWNKAFEKAGFYDAIQVRQQENDATWDPEDIRYNTFRWITSSASFAMGPSRVNPTTGQILDADIIFDADFLQYWKREYETFTPKGLKFFTGTPLDFKDESDGHNLEDLMSPPFGHLNHTQCSLMENLSQQFALGATVMATRSRDPKELEKLIMQGLKEVTMHEVGHTLGLRHNFKASTLYSLEDMNDTEKTNKTGLTGSVMDYAPANLVPKEMKQGDFFSTTIGPYDMWAIEYGYKPFSGGTNGEVKELKKIASRSGQPELAYATDEDARAVRFFGGGMIYIDPDPEVNRFDMGNDIVAFARQQAQLVGEAWPGVIDRMTEEGDGFQQARRAFGVLLATHGQAMHLASRYISGLSVTRSHKGDAEAKAPFVVVDPEKQRSAMALLVEQVFSDKPFQFPPELYNHLAASRWRHWGERMLPRTDYPVHEVILMWQDRVLLQLLSSYTLERLHDSEMKVPDDQDAFTTAELIEGLTAAIFSELGTLEGGEYTNRKPAISSLRRNLQRRHLKRLSFMAMYGGVPQDCQTIAHAELVRLDANIKKLLNSNVKLDSYTRAHLEESSSRITKVVEARLELLTP